LSKRLLAAFLVTLFIVATFATVAEVQAHYTLGYQGHNGPEYPMGDSTNTMPDTHKPGHLGYVYPGHYYQTPSSQWNYYSPNGAIITETSGGLWFVLNFSSMTTYESDFFESIAIVPPANAAINITMEANNWRGNWLYIAIPPEFGVPEGWDTNEGNVVVTSLSNDYSTIKTGKFSSTHSLAPNWWYVAFSAWTKPDDAARGWLYSAFNDPYKDRQRGPTDGFYDVWIGGLTAPACAGKYFFKIFYTDPSWWANPSEKYISFPPENYPTLVVKGELDPGYISGRLLYCGSYYFGYFYGKPIWKAGRVKAEGEAIDPVTNEPTGRKVCGVGYFNATADGFYEIEGLAPGIYKLTAEAAGFPPITLATEITVKRGQSIHGVDIYVCPGAKIRLKVNSKCPTGRVDFPSWVAIKSTELGEKFWYWHDYPLGDYYAVIKDSEGNFVADKYGTWTLAGDGLQWFTAYFGDETSYEGAEVVWDGHVPDDSAHYVSGVSAGVYYAYVNVFGYVQLEDYEVVVPSAQYTGEIYREMDIFQGAKATATIHFHNQEIPSADSPPVIGGDLILEAYDADGNLRAWNFTHVTANDPNAKSVSLGMIGDVWVPYGMNAGTYTFKVWYPGYAQQEFPQHTMQLCTTNSFSFHLVKGGNISVSVFSRDWQSPAQKLNWLHPPAALRLYFYNSAGEEVGHKDKTQVADVDEVEFSFDGMHWSIDDYIGYYWEPFGPLRPSGLPTDVYSIKGFTVGYIQKTVPEVWVQKASSTGDIPLYLFAGAAIKVIVNFKTEELVEPLSTGRWSMYFRVNVFDEEGNLAAANITSVPTETTWMGPDGLVRQWQFMVVGFSSFTTPGYLVPYPVTGEWFSRVTGSTPSDAWGYIEPFTMVKHYNYGIDAGTYTIEVNRESGQHYIQTATVAVTVALMGEATVYLDMHLLAYIWGNVYQRNWMGDFKLASWYTAELTGPAGTAATDTEDGYYEFFEPAGTYTLKVYLAAPDQTDAVVVQERTVVVTWGAVSGNQDFYMEEGGVPIPEFPAAGVLMLISALAASLYLLRWRKQAIVPMP